MKEGASLRERSACPLVEGVTVPKVVLVMLQELILGCIRLWSTT